MFGDNSNLPVIIAACGLSVVCLGVLGILAFGVARFTGGTLLGLIGSLTGGGTAANDADIPGYQIGRPRRPRLNLEAQAQSLDFDAAVAKYRDKSSPPTNTMDLDANLNPTMPPVLDNESDWDSDNRRDRRDGPDRPRSEQGWDVIDDGDVV